MNTQNSNKTGIKGASSPGAAGGQHSEPSNPATDTVVQDRAASLPCNTEGLQPTTTLDVDLMSHKPSPEVDIAAPAHAAADGRGSARHGTPSAALPPSTDDIAKSVTALNRMLVSSYSIWAARSVPRFEPALVLPMRAHAYLWLSRKLVKLAWTFARKGSVLLKGKEEDDGE